MNVPTNQRTSQQELVVTSCVDLFESKGFKCNRVATDPEKGIIILDNITSGM